MNDKFNLSIEDVEYYYLLICIHCLKTLQFFLRSFY